MVSHVEELRAHFNRMQEMVEWGKQSREHGMVSMSFRCEALLKVASATLDEHASHFAQYAEDKEGCASCFYLNELVK